MTKERVVDRKYTKVLQDIDNKCIENVEEAPAYGYGVRHIQIIILFTSLSIIYISRAHVSATIVGMTDVPKPMAGLINITENEFIKKENFINNMTREVDLNEPKNNIKQGEDLNNNKDKNKLIVNSTPGHKKQLNESAALEIKEGLHLAKEFEINKTNSIWNVFKVYDWPKSTQEMVLGSFFIGYLIMMTPMGLVTQRYGGKLPLQICLFSTAIVTFFIPWLALWGDYKAVCISRVIMGLTQSGSYPSIHTLIAKWVPVSERSRMATYVYTGAHIGTMLAYHFSGFLMVSRVGWPLVFWVIGILCLLMGLIVTWFVSNSPQKHRLISAKEKNFILGGKKDQTEKRHPTPWKSIMTSKPVLGVFVAHIGASITFLFMFSQIPTYLHHAVGINVKNSGLLSSLPYLANFLCSIVLGIVSDYCINNKILSMKLVRIISNTIANVGPALGLFALSYITSPELAVSCLIFSMATYSGCHTGWIVNYIDLSPNFSGTLMATGNTIMNISALLLTVLVSHTVTDVTDVNQWRIVLFTVGGIALVSNTVFVFLMSADVQSWNDPDYHVADQEDPDIQEGNTNSSRE